MMLSIPACKADPIHELPIRDPDICPHEPDREVVLDEIRVDGCVIPITARWTEPTHPNLRA